MLSTSKSFFRNPSAGGGGTTDPSFAYVPLLLETTGTNGQQNNTFLDSSTNAFTITRNGTPTQGSRTPYWPNGQWSNYFNGNGDYLTFANNAAFTFGTGDFTVECWLYRVGTGTGSGTYECIIGGNTSSSPYWELYVNSSNNTLMWFGNDGVIRSTSNSISNNTWTHVAVSRTSNVLKMFINGVEGYSATVTTSYSIHPNGGRIAFDGPDGVATNNKYFYGYISNIRVVKGVGVYTGAFTPPTSPLQTTQSAGTNISAITGTQTSLLTCQSNRFKDNSNQTPQFTIATFGTPTVQAFQPFSPAASYSAATYAGSGYFNGSTDYLSAASNAALGVGSLDFTIETWVYFTDVTGAQIVFDARTAQPSQAPVVSLQSTSRFLYLWNSASFVGFGPTTLSPFTWYHVAVVRSAGVHTGYVNGVSYSLSTTDAAGVASAPMIVGARTVGGAADYLKGYLSNFRMVEGTAVYTGAFTPPTLAPLATTGPASAASYSSTTNVNTTFLTPASLLLNMANAGIYDAAAQNDITTVGDAKTDTTIKQWPLSSVKFDGTGDWLLMPNNPAFAFGTGDFTIECWVYFTSVSGAPTITDSRSSTSSTAGFNLGLSSARVQLYTTSQLLIGGTTLVINQWYYIAVTRVGTALKIFVNGSQDATTSNSTNFSDQTLVIGATPNLVNPMTGYIQDLRLTKGVGRTITASPTAAFPTR